MSVDYMNTPEEGSIVYDKTRSAPVAEAVILQVREDTTAKDAILSEEKEYTVADVYSTYSPDAAVVEVATARRIERTIGEAWSVEDVRHAVADGEITTNTYPATMFSETLGERGSSFYEQIRRRTEGIDGIGPATTESITREFDNLADIERAVEAFPESERRIKRCRKGNNPDATLTIVLTLEDVVDDASQTTLATAGGEGE
jgi:hypothetical protein